MTTATQPASTLATLQGAPTPAPCAHSLSRKATDGATTTTRTEVSHGYTPIMEWILYGGHQIFVCPQVLTLQGSRW